MSQQSVSGLLQYEKTFVILRNSSSTVSKSGPAWVQFQLSLYKCRQSSCSQPQPIVQQHRRLTKLLFLSPFILGGMFTDFVPSGASVFPPVEMHSSDRWNRERGPSQLNTVGASRPGVRLRQRARPPADTGGARRGIAISQP